ncbi:MAG: CoA-acylating methylmalonate-semialdehyde dehydrogenase [Actinomycetota bacterium]|nr:CoA-acylating methylmalonate-semialdehyde dehydrogenase [Actinomycetota bacterium]
MIAGEVDNDSSAGQGPVFNPATGEEVAQLPFAGTETVERAVASALDGADLWSRTSVSRRASVMFEIRNKLREHADELADLIVRENGKTKADALGEVNRGLESVEFACGIPQMLQGTHSSNASAGIDVHSVRAPLGVVGAITPFNFPVMVPLWMLSNAIACGNSVVFKPSERAPSAPTRMAELMIEAGLPANVLNVVHGDRSVVEGIIDHPEISGLSFVGSTPVAQAVYIRGAGAGKRVQALGGAKNHMVVLPDADIDVAADAAVAAGFGAAGERCMAISVILAVGDIGDELIEAIKQRGAATVVGAGAQEGVEMGPLITEAHRDRVANYIALAASDGAEIVLDGRDAECSSSPGFFLGPTLIDGVSPGMDAYDEEIFGPVIGVMRVDSLEEATRLVRDNPFGNGTAIFTGDGGSARRFQLECGIGMVGVNVPIPVPVAWSSFGGWKSSLFGDTHMYGPEGVRFFTRQQVVTTRWP